MWEWREDATRGGWRLDAHGSWIWDEPSPLARVGAGTDALRRGFGEVRDAAPALALVGAPALPRPVSTPPTGRGGRPAGEPTPIFQELAVGRSRREEDDRYTARFAEDPGPWSAGIPSPHPGSGPLPIQRPDDAPRRGLGHVPTVEAPPAPGLPAAPAESPEDELRRRAERRRRPRAEEQAVPNGGRHALLPREEPVRGRHALQR